MRLLGCVVLGIGLALAQTALAQSYSRTEAISYYDTDSSTAWLLGQVSSVTCLTSTPTSTACNGDDVIKSATFRSTDGMPLSTLEFGVVQSTFSYDGTSTVASGQRGTLKTVTNGNSKAITFTNWKAGIPQQISLPDGNSKSAVVDGNGWISSTTDELSSKTCYSYDPMGRMTGTTFTSEATANTCDGTASAAWVPTTQIFTKLTAADLGGVVAAGNWRQVKTTGNAVQVTYYDTLWRPFLVREYDASNVAATESFTKTSYDLASRVQFVSYPSTSSTPTSGVWTSYDSLSRVTSVSEDSELGAPLVTTTSYTTGFKQAVTNPRLKTTITSYQTFDEPTTAAPVSIVLPENVTTTIVRDPYGKTLSITRGASN